MEIKILADDYVMPGKARSSKGSAYWPANLQKAFEQLEVGKAMAFPAPEGVERGGSKAVSPTKYRVEEHFKAVGKQFRLAWDELQKCIVAKRLADAPIAEPAGDK